MTVTEPLPAQACSCIQGVEWRSVFSPKEHDLGFLLGRHPCQQGGGGGLLQREGPNVCFSADLTLFQSPILSALGKEMRCVCLSDLWVLVCVCLEGMKIIEPNLFGHQLRGQKDLKGGCLPPGGCGEQGSRGVLFQEDFWVVFCVCLFVFVVVFRLIQQCTA